MDTSNKILNFFMKVIFTPIAMIFSFAGKIIKDILGVAYKHVIVFFGTLLGIATVAFLTAKVLGK